MGTVVLQDLIATISKLEICGTPSSPIKTTIASQSKTSKTPNHDKIKHSPPTKINKKGNVMAVVAVAKYGQACHHKSSKKATKEKLILVLLESYSIVAQMATSFFMKKGHPRTSLT